MKATKAHKRLVKIEAWMSKVRDRFSASAPSLENVLQEATAAVARAKKAVGLQASSETKARKNAVGKKTAPKTTAKTTKKRMPIEKATKKGAAKETNSTPVVQTRAAAQ